MTGSASAGATSISLANGSGTMKSGDFIKFANHDKVYMVVADNSDVSSNNLTIEPELRVAVSSQAITYSSVPFTVFMTNDVQEFKTDTSGLFDFEIDCSESL
jgi:phosphopentomutase